MNDEIATEDLDGMMERLGPELIKRLDIILVGQGRALPYDDIQELAYVVFEFMMEPDERFDI